MCWTQVSMVFFKYKNRMNEFFSRFHSNGCVTLHWLINSNAGKYCSKAFIWIVTHKDFFHRFKSYPRTYKLTESPTAVIQAERNKFTLIRYPWACSTWWYHFSWQWRHLTRHLGFHNLLEKVNIWGINTKSS